MKVLRWAVKAFLVASLPVAMMSAHAQSYPDRPVRLVVTYPAGGPADLVARSLVQKLSRNTGANFVIDNRGGGGGNIGAQVVARAPHDGYTLLLLVVGHAINMSLYQNPGFSIVNDLDPVAPIASSPLILLANTSQPFTNVRQLIEAAKRDPQKYSYGSAGAGSAPHLAMEHFKKSAGIDLMHVPYKGGAPALVGTMGGEVQLMFDAMITGARAAETGKVRALGISDDKRSDAVPELATIAASGVPGFKALTWYGVAAPKGTPKEIVSKLNAEITKVLLDPTTREEFAKMGATPMPLNVTEFARFVAEEEKHWGSVVKSTGATVD